MKPVIGANFVGWIEMLQIYIAYSRFSRVGDVRDSEDCAKGRLK